MAQDSDRQLYLVGTGRFATEVAEWAREAGWSIAGLIEVGDGLHRDEAGAGHPLLTPRGLPEGARIVIAMGGSRSGNHARLGAASWAPATVVHPSAHVSPSARLGAGCIVAPGAVIGAETVIGEHTLVSRGALIGHHVSAGAFVSLLPGVNVGGNAEVGDRATIGMGAVVIDAISVGADATVAAGAVVVRDVATGARVQGVPAREYPRHAPRETARLRSAGLE